MDRIRLDAQDTLPLLRARVGDLAPRVLVVGDPARATRIAGMLDDAEQVAASREYLTYTGSHRGVPVSVLSHGVGSAGAGAVFEELCRAGVRRIVRVGTAGGLQPEVTDGHVVVVTGAVRCDGLSARMVPLNWPAIADPDVTLALRAAVSDASVPAHEGIVLTADNFFPSIVLEDDRRLWARAGALAVEMEVATLLTVASLYRVPAGAVVAIDGNPLAKDESMSDYQPDRAEVDRAVLAAIDAGLDAVIA